MKTEFLKGLGLEDEVIKQIMAENGKDITAEQKKTSKAETERDNYKEQFDTVSESLKKFDGVNLEDINKELETLKTTIADKEKEYNQKIADRDFSDSIKAAISSAGGKNDKAIMAMLDIETLKSSNNRDADIKAAIETCKTENDYMFGVKQLKGAVPGEAGVEDPDKAVDPSKMSYEELCAYMENNPDAKLD